MDSRVEKTLALLETNLHRKLPTEVIAQTLNLSVPRLRSLFRAETGEPLARYQKMRRLREAQSLLRTTALSLKQIMLRVGIADESHFVRDFKRAYQLSPTQYRTLCRDGRAAGAEAESGRPTNNQIGQ